MYSVRNQLIRTFSFLLLLPGCTFVKEPIGFAGVELSPDDIDGVWAAVTEKENGGHPESSLSCCYILEVVEPDENQSNSAGRFRMLVVLEDRGEIGTLRLEGHATRHKDAIFASIRPVPGANGPSMGDILVPDLGYWFGVVELRSRDEIAFRPPDQDMFDKSVSTQELLGDKCSTYNLCLAPFSEEDLDYLTSPNALEVHFPAEIVLRRLPVSVNDFE